MPYRNVYLPLACTARNVHGFTFDSLAAVSMRFLVVIKSCQFVE